MLVSGRRNRRSGLEGWGEGRSMTDRGRAGGMRESGGAGGLMGYGGEEGAKSHGGANGSPAQGEVWVSEVGDQGSSDLYGEGDWKGCSDSNTQMEG